MDQAISLRYMRTVQQLEKKTEEVDQLLRGARELDSENNSLRTKNDELTKQIAAMSENERNRDAEASLLESHVRRQQQRLQQYIDQEAMAHRGDLPLAFPNLDAARVIVPNEAHARSTEAPPVDTTRSNKAPKSHSKRSRTQSASSLKPPPLPVVATAPDLDDVRQRLLESEVGRASLQKDLESSLAETARAESEVAALRQTVSDLRHALHVRDDAMRDAARREDGMKATLRHLNQRHVSAALESRELEAIESKALEGLRAELLLLEAENEQLKVSLQEERQRYRDAKVEFEKTSALLSKQKTLFDAHQRLSAEEIQSLTAQLESILVDMRVASERSTHQNVEIVRLQEILAGHTSAKLSLVASQTPSSVPFVDPESAPKDSSSLRLRGTEDEGADAHARTVRDLLGRLSEVQKERDAASVELQHKGSLLVQQSSRVAQLEGEVDALKLQLGSLSTFTTEREAVEVLRKEKDAMQGDEIRRLQAALASAEAALAATRAEGSKVAFDPSRDVLLQRSDLQSLREAASACLVACTATYKLLESLARKHGPPSELIHGPPPAPMLTDATARAIFNDVAGSHITLLHMSSLAKQLLRNGMAADASPGRAAGFAVNLSGQSITHGPPMASDRRPRGYGRERYVEGLSLKDVVDDYRRTSPRRAAHVDSSSLSLRNPLQMAEWELRRLHMLEGHGF